jgi:NADH dehydrogenase/NADH:ubiquinone oxidoreductase subunit G
MADVILPSAAFSEENGHYTSFDGKIWKISKAVDAPGMSMQEWEMVCSLAKKLGSEEFNYGSTDDIWKEMVAGFPIFEEGKRPPILPRKYLIPVSEPSTLHHSEQPPYVVRFRGTPVHLLIDDLRIYLEENDRIPKGDSPVYKDDAPGKGVSA